jgi:hypothetical protein
MGEYDIFTDGSFDKELEPVAFMQLNIIETNTFDVITDLACIQTWFIASDDGVINLSPLVELAQANEAKLYLAERDVCHHKRLGRGPDAPMKTFWSDRTLQHAAVIWELGTANAKNTASAQRIIFDKHWHSWNQAKADADIDTVCERCGEPDSLKHLLDKQMRCQACRYCCSSERIDVIEYQFSYKQSIRKESLKNGKRFWFALGKHSPRRHEVCQG